MKDPFPLEPIPWLSKASQPLADLLGFPSLPYHIHEVVASALLYTVIYWPISPILSTLLAGEKYTSLSRRRRINWHAHVVSMAQSCLINALALWVIFVDKERAAMDAQQRLWGYTGACGMIQGMAAGYFVWDLVVTASNMDVFGPGTLAHAVAALVVYSLGFRPFVNYYGPAFILWELSTPFLNIHWFCDKLGLTGTKLQLYNGFALLFTFFTARLVFGTYQSYRVFTDIYALLGTTPDVIVQLRALKENTLAAPDAMPLLPDVYRFATDATTIPVWLGSAYLASNTTLAFLNFYWFFKMVTAVRKRFTPAAEDTKKPQAVAAASADAVASARISSEDPAAASKARRRKA